MKDPNIGTNIIIGMVGYTAIFLIGMAIITHQEIVQPPHQSVPLTIIQILIKGQAAALVAGGFAVSIETGAYIMVLGAYLAKQQIERMNAKTRRKAQNEAYRHANAEFAAYIRRMNAARDAGEPFNEPPPYFPTEEQD